MLNTKQVWMKQMKNTKKCKKHGNKYTPEQLKMWAQYIQLGKHDSTDEAPDKPYWRGRKRQNTLPQLPLAKRIATASVSPTKKISVRSELLDSWESGTSSMKME